MAGAALFAFSFIATACGQSSGISADDQDPACHSQALSIASSNPGFEWNESGMDHYHQAYDVCLRYAKTLGQN